MVQIVIFICALLLFEDLFFIFLNGYISRVAIQNTLFLNGILKIQKLGHIKYVMPLAC